MQPPQPPLIKIPHDTVISAHAISESHGQKLKIIDQIIRETVKFLTTFSREQLHFPGNEGICFHLLLLACFLTVHFQLLHKKYLSTLKSAAASKRALVRFQIQGVNKLQRYFRFCKYVLFFVYFQTSQHTTPLCWFLLQNWLVAFSFDK